MSASSEPPTLANGAPDYGSSSYWDERYATLEADGKATSFDWYQDYAQLKSHLLPYLRRDGDFSILIIGCGNSGVGAGLYEDGYEDIHSIDLSPVVIRHMADTHAHLKGMEFHVMDARAMDKYLDQSFDLVLDKALFDAQLCSRDNVTSVQRLVREVHRVLRPGGAYVMVSYGFPAIRSGYLTSHKAVAWAVAEKKLDKPPVPEGYEEQGAAKAHYLYACVKPPRRQGEGEEGPPSS